MSIATLKKADLIQQVVEKQLATPEEAQKLGRKDMINLLKGTTPFDNAQLEKEEITGAKVVITEVKPVEAPKDEKQVEQVPPIFREDWTDYLLTQFYKDELIDGHPTTDGLRRIFEKFIGEIISCKKDVLQTPDVANSHRATVHCAISYAAHGTWAGGRPNVVKEIQEASDCYFGNTAAPFYYHAVATASTMAEGRCYRKALGLKTLAKEETQGPKGDEAKLAGDMERSQNLATPNQKNVIASIAKQINVDVQKMITNDPNIKGTSIEDITGPEAQTLIRDLNNYRTKGVPEGLLQ